ncbi:MAG: pyridoxamine 5'-phosphate oxidase family protein [Pseudomonadaceae bacterium]|nr:pyridoxamine 5'-phosphate oxidase family protein [Pseudomonadaceae bacterium]
MADTRMSQAEREAFLADLHVGVLSIPRDGRAPLSAPVWYAYEPGGELWFLTGPNSLKGKLLKEGGSIAFVAQRETMPYAYVTVEGTISSITAADLESESRPMAHRYLGEEMGDAYTEQTAGDTSVRVNMRIDRWLTVDYGKSL